VTLLGSTPARAQCRGGTQQNRSSSPGMQQGGISQSAMRQQGGQSQFALQQYVLQQYALLQMYALQQQQQQNVLRAVLQQQQQQNALRVGLQQQQLNAMPAAALPPNAVQLRAMPTTADRGPTPKPESSEDAAARQVRVALELTEDADAARREGE